MRQFFDRIPRRALWALLGRYVGPATRTVIQRMAEAASTTGEGLGQGYAHVPFVATLYLAGALRKSKVVSVLYGDNMLVVGRSREEVERGIARLVRHTQRLGLEVHYAEPRPCAQANFLSIALRPTSDGGLEPALSDDCIVKLRDLLPVARTKREAHMRVYLESIRAACRPDS